MGEDASCCRVIFGEADQFPGLTVDRFGEVLVTQTLSAGHRSGLSRCSSRCCKKVLGRDGQADPRRLRAQRRRASASWRACRRARAGSARDGGPTRTEITENGIVYGVDFENGQKTGFFLDQKYNRRAVAKLARGRRVLDCFTHTGSFALNAAAGGAAHVCAVDVSADAVALAAENARRNGLDGRRRDEGGKRLRPAARTGGRRGEI